MLVEQHIAQKIYSGRDIENTTATTLLEIGRELDRRNFIHSQEAVNVALTSVGFLGLPYKMEEELGEAAIDCSTLTSQSYWEGAAIGIPFTADRQRTAGSGIVIKHRSELLPGDVVCKYPGVETSPDQTHNHVGLFVGWDKVGKEWVIESVEPTGVQISSLDKFNPQGGIVRYMINPLVSFNSGDANKALELARLVPKLGRLGANQYRKNGQRQVHIGIDIYAGSNCEVIAPISGTVRLLDLKDEGESPSVEIVNHNRRTHVFLGHVQNEGLNDGQNINFGLTVGKVTLPPPNSSLVYWKDGIDQAHLHFVFATREKILQPSVEKNGLHS